MCVSVDGMARVQGAVFAGAVYDQRPTAYDETDQRPSVYDETDQGATYDEFDIGFGSRPNGVNRDGRAREAFGNLQGHGWQAPAEAFENEAIGYSLGNSFGERICDGWRDTD